MTHSMTRLAVAVVCSAGALTACGEAPDPEQASQLEQALEVLVSTRFIYDGYDGNPLTTCTVSDVTGRSATMHCCPKGFAMTGAHLDRNVFKCSPLHWTIAREGILRFLDSSTAITVGGVTMHGCPSPSLMVGFHKDLNLLACMELKDSTFGFPYLPEDVRRSLDAGTTDQFPMHVCKAGGAMAGIHVDQNKFTCEFPAPRL